MAHPPLPPIAALVTGLKRCSCCGEWKPATAEFFYERQNPSWKDGFHPHCKVCQIAASWKRSRLKRIARAGCRADEDRKCLEDRERELENRAAKKLARKLRSTQVCPMCKEDKPATLEFFPVANTEVNGLRRQCRDCMIKYNRGRPRIRKPSTAADRKRRRDYQKSARGIEMRNRWRDRERLRVNFSVNVRQSLNAGAKGGRSWESVVGYTVEDLRTHLERQFIRHMSWDNYGIVWHVDHIVPLASFNFTSTDDPEFMAAWALTNLRPLWKRANMRKGGRRRHLI